MPAIVNAPGGPYAAGSTPVYTALLVDQLGQPIAGSNLTTLTLSIVDTLTGAVILPSTDILNTDRGTIDALGNLTITLEPTDTAIGDVDGSLGNTEIERALIIDFTYNGGRSAGRHQVNFILLALAGP